MFDESKSNPTVGARLLVDLRALRANYTTLAACAAPGSIGAVVKANAYGLGADRIATELAAHGCEHFFVAYLEEGVALRGLLPDAQIYVMSPLLHPDIDVLRANKLLACLYDKAQIRTLAARAAELGIAIPVVLHVDSGIHRLGLTGAEFEDVLKDDSLKPLRIERVMSHLACSDDEAASFNVQQQTEFERLIALSPATPVTLANSGGVFLGSEFSPGLSRVGISLYGVDPHAKQRLETVCTFDAPILQLRDLDIGDRVGYGGTAVVRRPTRIAVVRAGYADGVIRHLGESSEPSAYVGLRGTRAPFIGRISMDLLTVDVTDIPDAAVGDRVEIFGPTISVDEQARNTGTIAYELFTGIGSRVQRTYLDD